MAENNLEMVKRLNAATVAGIGISDLLSGADKSKAVTSVLDNQAALVSVTVEPQANVVTQKIKPKYAKELNIEEGAIDNSEQALEAELKNIDARDPLRAVERAEIEAKLEKMQLRRMLREKLVATHGSYDKEKLADGTVGKDLIFSPKSDTDGSVATWMLRKFAGNNVNWIPDEEKIYKNKDGAIINKFTSEKHKRRLPDGSIIGPDGIAYVPQGEEAKGAQNVDTSKKGSGMDRSGYTVHHDHHGDHDKDHSSATEEVFNDLIRAELIDDANKKVLKKLVDFVSAVDNVDVNNSEYADYLRNYYNSKKGVAANNRMFGLYRMLNPEQLWDFFKDGHSGNDDLRLLNDGDLERYGILTNKEENGELKVEDKRQSHEKLVEQSSYRIQKLVKKGLVFDSEQYGKVVVSSKKTDNIPGRSEAVYAKYFSLYKKGIYVACVAEGPEKDVKKFIAYSSTDLPDSSASVGILVRKKMLIFEDKGYEKLNELLKMLGVEEKKIPAALRIDKKEPEPIVAQVVPEPVTVSNPINQARVTDLRRTAPLTAEGVQRLDDMIKAIKAVEDPRDFKAMSPAEQLEHVKFQAEPILTSAKSEEKQIGDLEHLLKDYFEGDQGVHDFIEGEIVRLRAKQKSAADSLLVDADAATLSATVVSAPKVEPVSIEPDPTSVSEPITVEIVPTSEEVKAEDFIDFDVPQVLQGKIDELVTYRNGLANTHNERRNIKLSLSILKQVLKLISGSDLTAKKIKTINSIVEKNKVLCEKYELNILFQSIVKKLQSDEAVAQISISTPAIAPTIEPAESERLESKPNSLNIDNPGVISINNNDNDNGAALHSLAFDDEEIDFIPTPSFLEFGIHENDYLAIEETVLGDGEALSEGQRVLVRENLRQLIIGQIQAEALEKQKEAVSNVKSEYGLTGKFLGRLWLGLKNVGGFQVKKNEQELAGATKEGGKEKYGEMLAHLIAATAASGTSIKVVDGKIKINYVKATNEKDEKSFEGFNEAAQAFSVIPLDWGHNNADKANQKTYQKAFKKYQDLRGDIFLAKKEELGNEEEAMKFVAELDARVQMDRFYKLNPDAEARIQEIKDESVWVRAGKEMFSQGWKYSAFGLVSRYATISLVGASAVASGAVLPASLAIAAGIGYWRGKDRARKDLGRNEASVMRGEIVDAAARHNKAGIGSLEEKMRVLVDRISNESDDNKKADLISKLESRYDFTLKKIQDGNVKVNKESRLAQLYALQAVLMRAQATIDYSLKNKDEKKKIEDRLVRILNINEERISEQDKQYITNKAIVGGIMSSVFFFGGRLLHGLDAFTNDVHETVNAGESIVNKIKNIFSGADNKISNVPKVTTGVDVQGSLKYPTTETTSVFDDKPSSVPRGENKVIEVEMPKTETVVVPTDKQVVVPDDAASAVKENISGAYDVENIEIQSIDEQEAAYNELVNKITGSSAFDEETKAALLQSKNLKALLADGVINEQDVPVIAGQIIEAQATVLKNFGVDSMLNHTLNQEQISFLRELAVSPNKKIADALVRKGEFTVSEMDLTKKILDSEKLFGHGNNIKEAVLENLKLSGDPRAALATVYKGEGILHSFTRQLEANPYLVLEDGAQMPEDLHDWAQTQAYKLAIKSGYVEIGTDRQIAIGRPNEVAYILTKEGVEEFGKDDKGNYLDNMKGRAFDKVTFKDEDKATFKGVNEGGIEAVMREESDVEVDQVVESEAVVKAEELPVSIGSEEAAVASIPKISAESPIINVSELSGKEVTKAEWFNLPKNEEIEKFNNLLVGRNVLDSNIVRTEFNGMPFDRQKFFVDYYDHIANENVGAKASILLNRADIDRARIIRDGLQQQFHDNFVAKYQTMMKGVDKSMANDILRYVRMSEGDVNLRRLDNLIGRLDASRSAALIGRIKEFSLPPEQYAHYFDVVEMIDKFNLSSIDQRESLFKMFYQTAFLRDNQEDVLREFFGKDNYKEIETFFGADRLITRGPQGTEVRIVLDQLRGNWNDKFIIMISPTGTIEVSGPLGHDMDPVPLSKESIDNVVKKIVDFLPEKKDIII